MFAARGGFLFQPEIAPIGGFGNNSLFPGNSDQYIGVAGATNLVTWKATTGFTLEYWFYATAWPGSINPGPGNHDAGGTNYWSFGPGANGQVEFFYWGAGLSYFNTANSAVTLNTWNNIAFVATTVGSTATGSIYVNGVRQQIQVNKTGTFADTKSVTNGVISAGTPFRMGRYGSIRWTNFYMDNLRVSNVNRYSGAGYALATEPFTVDASTQLYLICNGANGSTVFTDSSTFNRTVTNNVNRVTQTNAKANHS